jgi:hypothetical protein
MIRGALIAAGSSSCAILSKWIDHPNLGRYNIKKERKSKKKQNEDEFDPEDFLCSQPSHRKFLLGFCEGTILAGKDSYHRTQNGKKP